MGRNKRKGPRTRSRSERAYGVLITLDGSEQPRARLEKKGLSRALLKQLELAGRLRPYRKAGQVFYDTYQLACCWRVLRQRGFRLNWWQHVGPRSRAHYSW